MSEKIRSKIDLSAKKIVAGWPKVGYDDHDEKVRDFYSKFSGKTTSRTSIFAHKKLADMFIFAMVLGKHEGIKKPYDKKQDRRETIDIESIAQQPEYLWMMLAVAIDEANGDLGIFLDYKTRIIDVCEEYANYGITLLMDMDEEASPADPYSGYEEKFKSLLESFSE